MFHRESRTLRNKHVYIYFAPESIRYIYLYGRALRRQGREPTDVTEVDGYGIKRLRLHFFTHFQLFCY